MNKTILIIMIASVLFIAACNQTNLSGEAKKVVTKDKTVSGTPLYDLSVEITEARIISNVYGNDSLNYTFRYCNLGGLATAGTLGVSLNGPLSGSGYGYPIYLDVNECRNGNGALAVTTVGNYTLLVQVNTSNGTDEDWSNNYDSRTVTYNGIIDMAAEILWFTRNETNQSIASAYSRVYNNGEVATWASVSRSFSGPFGGGGGGSSPILFLPGQSKYYIDAITLNSYGEYTYTRSVSAEGDRDTSNNQASATLIVGPEPTPSCTDSDGGKDYFTKGFINWTDGTSTSSAWDICISGYLTEWFCNGDTANATLVNCKYGCNGNGACDTYSGKPPPNIQVG